MIYCSITDIQGVIPHEDLVQLTNDVGGDTVDTDKITDAISYADNIIDGYLRARYSLPLDTVPECLTAWLKNIMRWLKPCRIYKKERSASAWNAKKLSATPRLKPTKTPQNPLLTSIIQS